MKTQTQIQTENCAKETLRLMKQLAGSDPDLKASILKSVKDSHREVIDSFRNEILESITSGKMTTDEAAKCLRKITQGD